jgi:hypothetical protein
VAEKLHSGYVVGVAWRRQRFLMDFEEWPFIQPVFHDIHTSTVATNFRMGKTSVIVSPGFLLVSVREIFQKLCT